MKCADFQYASTDTHDWLVSLWKTGLSSFSSLFSQLCVSPARVQRWHHQTHNLPTFPSESTSLHFFSHPYMFLIQLLTCLCSSFLIPPSFVGSRSSGSNRSGNKAGALETKSGGSGSETEKREKAPSECSAAPPSEHSIHSVHSALSQGHNSSYGPPAAPAPGSPSARDLASVPPELTASRQSFRMAMGNPSEFFVDVM